MPPAIAGRKYRGRLAPSPTGYLHLGHARTFWAAQERARANGGELILRNEDLDSTRYQMDFVEAMLEDLRWFGFEWSEGPDIGGPFAPVQSKRADGFLPRRRCCKLCENFSVFCRSHLSRGSQPLLATKVVSNESTLRCQHYRRVGTSFHKLRIQV